MLCNGWYWFESATICRDHCSAESLWCWSEHCRKNHTLAHWESHEGSNHRSIFRRWKKKYHWSSSKTLSHGDGLIASREDALLQQIQHRGGGFTHTLDLVWDNARNATAFAKATPISIMSVARHTPNRCKNLHIIDGNRERWFLTWWYDIQSRILIFDLKISQAIDDWMEGDEWFRAMATSSGNALNKYVCSISSG